MVSREHNTEAAAALHEKLQLLRSITKSRATNETSIVLDASNYIKELKQKVERLQEDIATAENPAKHRAWPKVTVTNLDRGFLVSVHSGRNCPGLLVSILEAIEELGLNVSEARVSCADSFHLQALGGEDEGDEECIKAHMVKRAISIAIKIWNGSIDDDQ